MTELYYSPSFHHSPPCRHLVTFLLYIFLSFLSPSPSSSLISLLSFFRFSRLCFFFVFSLSFLRSYPAHPLSIRHLGYYHHHNHHHYHHNHHHSHHHYQTLYRRGLHIYSKNWENKVNELVNNSKNSKEFWNKFNILKGKNIIHTNYKQD